MDLYTLERKIDQFWSWFKENEAEFRGDNPELLVEQMNNLVLDFGIFKWEIAQTEDQHYYLLISPNNDAARLKISQAIIEAAPRLKHWYFYPSYPPKEDWDYTFEMYDSFMLKQKYSASNWYFLLFEAVDRDAFELDIRARNLSLLDDDDQLMAVNLVVRNLIGEATKIKYLDQINFVDDFEPEDETAAMPIQNLRKKLLSLV